MTPRVNIFILLYFLPNVDVIILCRQLSESTMSILGLSPRLLQAASTAEHVSLWGHSNGKWMTVWGLFQELQSPFGCFPIWCIYALRQHLPRRSLVKATSLCRDGWRNFFLSGSAVLRTACRLCFSPLLAWETLCGALGLSVSLCCTSVCINRMAQKW